MCANADKDNMMANRECGAHTTIGRRTPSGNSKASSLGLCTLLCLLFSADGSAAARPVAVKIPVSESVLFEANVGQGMLGDRYVAYTAQGMAVHLRDTSLQVRLSCSDSASTHMVVHPQAHAFGIEFVDAHPEDIRGTGRMSTTNYWKGTNSFRDIATSSAVQYRGLYEHIDATVYGNAGNLEYDIELLPGSAVSDVRLRFMDVDKLTVDPRGDLLITVHGHVLRQTLPAVYQLHGSKRVPIEAKYSLISRFEVGFRVEHYDPMATLTIDPLLFTASFLTGGQSESGYASASDAAGNIYIAGQSLALSIPSGSLGSASGNGDALIEKFNSRGQLVFRSFIGGPGGESAAWGIGLDSKGNIAVVGETFSTALPVSANAVQSRYGGNGDGFVAELDPSGTRILFCSYFGGSGRDSAYGMIVDRTDNIALVGVTESVDLPVTSGSLQTTYAGGGDGFVAKLNPQSVTLVYSTYFGKLGRDVIWGVSAEPNGSTLIVGETTSGTFVASSNAFQRSSGGNSDAFLAELDATGKTISYFSYIGGAGDDRAFAVAQDSTGHVYVVGETSSNTFPASATGSQRSLLSGLGDAFLISINHDGTLGFSTTFGGSGEEAAYGVAVGPTGLVYLAGWTDSSDFPVTADAHHLHYGGGDSDAFLVCIDPSSTGAITYASLLGGEAEDLGYAVTSTADGLYVVGTTDSSQFDPPAAISTEPPGDQTFFSFFRLDNTTRTVSPASITLGASGQQQFQATGVPNIGVTWSISPTVGTIGNAGLYQAPALVATAQTIMVTATSTADFTKTATALITLQPTTTMTVSPVNPSLSAGQQTQFTAAISGVTNTAVTWSISPTVGTIGNAGLYQAPATVATAQTIMVAATSTADITKMATTLITLQPTTTMTVSPVSPSLSAGQQALFTATISGVNTAVTWSISPAVGTIFKSGTIANAGLYQAPAVVAATQTITVMATSTADITKTATALITLKAATAATVIDDKTFVTQVYRDVLGREPDSGGLQYWMSILSSKALTRAQLVSSFFSSPEIYNNSTFIVKVYLTILHKTPDFAGWTNLLSQLHQGSSQADIVNSVLTSSVALSVSSSDEAFVTAAYRTVLGREPDSGGLLYWKSVLQSGFTRAGLVMSFVQGAEVENKLHPAVFSNLLYLALLRRTADAAGLSFYTNVLASSGDLLIISNFINSPEYLGRF